MSKVLVILASLLFGLAVFGTSACSAWYTGAKLYEGDLQQETTESQLSEINDAMGSFYVTYKRYAKSLVELDESTHYSKSIYFNGRIADAWGHPFTYTVSQSGYLAISYGRDGKPGGFGLNADLSTSHPIAAPASVSFLRFLRIAKGVAPAAIFSGVLACLFAWSTLSSADLAQLRNPATLSRVSMTAIAIMIVAAVITSLQLASGE